MDEEAPRAVELPPFNCELSRREAIMENKISQLDDAVPATVQMNW